MKPKIIFNLFLFLGFYLFSLNSLKAQIIQYVPPSNYPVQVIVPYYYNYPPTVVRPPAVPCYPGTCGGGSVYYPGAKGQPSFWYTNPQAPSYYFPSTPSGVFLLDGR